jgi:2-phospho-L-lactate guanylyltransferase
MKSVWALVPVKDFARAKSRLKPRLGDEERSALARSLCEHVLSVLSECRELAGVLCVTDSAEVGALAETRGARVRLDPTDSLGAAVHAGLMELRSRGAKAALVVMSDLPRLRACDVEAVLAKLAEADVVAVPDQQGEGTNALALAPPDAFLTRFGTHGSFSEHMARAATAGLRVSVHRSEAWAFDVDAPEDVEVMSGMGRP